MNLYVMIKKGVRMRISEIVSNDKIKELLNKFYGYFNTGYDFEEFLKPFLENLGLSEVAVTKKTGDGGIDLFAVRKGIDEIAGADYVKYRIQAKRYSPSITVTPEKIDALRGNLQYNEKGLFITTGKVTDKAKEQAVMKDPYKPVYVIDGTDLIRVCIDKQIGFTYIPQFSSEALDEFTNKTQISITSINSSNVDYVDKLITKNDIRCTILSIPRYIVEKIKNNTLKKKIDVIVNGCQYKLTFVPIRNYLYCGTEFFEKYKLKNNDGSVVEKFAKWSIDNNETINIIIN